MESGPRRLEFVPIKPGQHHVTLLPRTATDLPFFYFTKRKDLLTQEIKFEGMDQEGRPMRWSVTPNNSRGIGAPAVEAHEVWVRLVLPAITETRGTDGQIPEIVPLGRLRESLRLVGWTEGGWEARRLLRALRQIGAAWCVADLWLPTSEVDESGQPKFTHIKGEFSRMALYAIGSKHVTEDQLKNGKFTFEFDLDDTVYVQLHPLEVSLQRQQPPRLVDNRYLFAVSPVSRRWYELLAPKIYGALKHRREYCEVRYSWYVQHHHTLTRQHERRRVVEQMNRAAVDHLRSGYVERVEYRIVKEPGQEIDYMVRYYPGPEAKASIERIRSRNIARRKATIKIPAYTDGEVGEIDERFIEEPPARKPRKPRDEGREHPLLDELTRRGIAPLQAEKLLARIEPDQPVEDQLDWIDSLVARGDIQNPPGLYVSLIRDNITVPPEFETSRKRQLREQLQQANAARDRDVAELKLQYDRYRDEEIDRYIAENDAEYQRLHQAKQEQFLSNENIAWRLSERSERPAIQ